jgi:hypothetical protein
MSKTQVFVSFDIEHDGELFEELRTQSSSSGFAVLGCSERVCATEAWSEGVRRRIREADQAHPITAPLSDFRAGADRTSK